jgi:hypothetical protein
MKNGETVLLLLGTFLLLTVAGPTADSQEKAAPKAVQVHMVITDAALRDDKELPPLQRENVKVKQGKTFLRVTQLIPAQCENAALQLIFLIDDGLNTSVANNLTDIKDFISAQPPSTVIAVGYMSNAGVNVVQNFTADHDLAVKAVRLPPDLWPGLELPQSILLVSNQDLGDAHDVFFRGENI